MKPSRRRLQVASSKRPKDSETRASEKPKRNVPSGYSVGEGFTHANVEFEPMSPTRLGDEILSPIIEGIHMQSGLEEPYDAFHQSYKWCGEPHTLDAKNPGDRRKSKPKGAGMKTVTKDQAEVAIIGGRRRAEIR